MRTKLDTKTVRKHMNTETKRQKEKQTKIKANGRKNKKTARKFFGGSENTNKNVWKKKEIAKNNDQDSGEGLAYIKGWNYHNTNAMFWY